MRVNRIGKAERSEKSHCAIEQGNRVGPSNVEERVRDCGGFEKYTLAVINDAVGGRGKFVPKWTEATSRVGQGRVVGVLSEEVAIVVATGKRTGSLGGGVGLVYVNLDQVPSRSESAFGPVRNEEEAVAGFYDGSVEIRF